MGLGRPRANFGQLRAKFGRRRARFGQVCHKFCECGPSLETFGRVRPDRCCSMSVQIWPTSRQSWSIDAAGVNVWSNLGSNRDKFGRQMTELHDIRPNFGPDGNLSEKFRLARARARVYERMARSPSSLQPAATPPRLPEGPHLRATGGHNERRARALSRMHMRGDLRQEHRFE